MHIFTAIRRLFTADLERELAESRAVLRHTANVARGLAERLERLEQLQDDADCRLAVLGRRIDRVHNELDAYDIDRLAQRIDALISEQE